MGFACEFLEIKRVSGRRAKRVLSRERSKPDRASNPINRVDAIFPKHESQGVLQLTSSVDQKEWNCFEGGSLNGDSRMQPVAGSVNDVIGNGHGTLDRRWCCGP